MKRLSREEFKKLNKLAQQDYKRCLKKQKELFDGQDSKIDPLPNERLSFVCFVTKEQWNLFENGMMSDKRKNQLKLTGSNLEAHFEDCGTDRNADMWHNHKMKVMRTY